MQQPTGLINLGNMCFMNSTIQIIRHTNCLNQFLDNNSCEKKNIVETVIYNEWNDLRNFMNTKPTTVSPKRFVYQIQQTAKAKNMDLFAGYSQNDLAEFLLFFVECLHSSISRPVVAKVSNPQLLQETPAKQCFELLKNIYAKEYSEIMDMFYGIYISEILSEDGSIIHNTVAEQYLILDLELPTDLNKNIINLYDCLDKFTRPELLQDENAWFNEKTGQKENIQKRMRFWNFPKVLIITLKRFSPDGMHKMNQFVNYPIVNFDLEHYACGNNAHQYVYDLYGVCCHYGMMNGGHYTAYIKTGGEWMHYNDSTIEKCRFTDALSPYAYCLFYERQE
jgi:ubiquitin carboxyl-terminal hydrolase 8